jgi:hypothetical protein
VTFEDEREFRTVLDRAFGLMDADPEMGPKLRDADVPQRFEFPDLDLVMNVRAATADEGRNIVWTWIDDPDFEPKVTMTMSSETANRYFQGKENIALALARRRIKSKGDVRASLKLIPITEPVFAQYRAMVEAEFPHLVVR